MNITPMGKGEIKEWLLWMAERLIDARVSFSLNPMSDGQWNVGVDDEAASRKVSALVMQWKRDHELRA